MIESQPYPLPVFAVFDPDCERWKAWTEALKEDHVELESHRFENDDPAGLPVYRLKASSLGPDQLVGICRMLARRDHLAEASVLMEAIYGAGIRIAAAGIFVCKDPDFGRRYFARLRRKKGGRRD